MGRSCRYGKGDKYANRRISKEAKRITSTKRKVCEKSVRDDQHEVWTRVSDSVAGSGCCVAACLTDRGQAAVSPLITVVRGTRLVAAVQTN
jgi:hypothetical protein